jgi:hypothetical protein
VVQGTVLNAGQFLEINLSAQTYVESDKPILVAQYAKGSQCSGNPGDPDMILITSLEQFLPSYTFTTFNGFVVHFVNLIAPDSIVGSLTMDGVAIPIQYLHL